MHKPIRFSPRASRWFGFVILLLLCGRLLAQTAPDFTPEERQWIKDHPVVTFAADPWIPPIESMKDGKYTGVVAEYLKAITQKSGLVFRYVPTKDWDDAQRAFLDGRVDLLPNVSVARVDMKTVQQMLLTDAYYATSTIIVTQGNRPVAFNADALDGKVVAIRPRGAYANIFPRRFPHATLLPVRDPAAALDAVKDGKADAAIGTDATFMPLLRRKYAGQLGVAGTMDDLPFFAQMGVRRDEPVLYSIIRKSLGSLSAVETDKMLENVLDQTDYGAPSLLSILRYRAWELLLLGLLIALLGVFAYRTRVAYRAAEKSELAKSRFLAVMSHEIRTPMNAVLASIEMLEQTNLDARQQKLASTAATASEALLGLLDNVLDLSKLDAKRLELERIPADVGALALKVADVVRMRAREKGLPIEVEIHDPIHRQVLIDPTRFRQVLLNLLTNALKFTEQGSITLRLEIAGNSAGQNNANLSVRVTDTGIGISPEQQAGLFQAYTQADSSTTRRYGGTGLGLTICKELVELMGGQISLESAVNVGTTVSFTLPVQWAKAIEPIAQETLAAEDTSPSRMAGTVLVVDDHPVNQFVIGEQLRELGVAVVMASDGQAALQTIEVLPFALVLMDCHMPGMDGYETTRRIREREAANGLAHLPVIAISAATDASHLKQCLESGMDAVLKKPLRLDELHGMLQVWMGQPTAPANVSRRSSLPADLASLYRSALREDVNALSTAINNHDNQAAGHLAHRLKGAALVAQLDAIAQLAGQLEALLDASIPDSDANARSLAEQLQVEVSQLPTGSPNEKVDID